MYTVYIYMYVCMYVYIYIYVYIYTYMCVCVYNTPDILRPSLWDVAQPIKSFNSNREISRVQNVPSKEKNVLAKISQV